MSLWEEARCEFERHLRDEEHEEPASIEEFMRSRKSLDEVKASAKSLQADSKRKYGSSDSEGKAISPKWIGRIMENLDTFVAFGDVAMKAAPESVSLAWFAVSSVLGAIQSDYKLYGTFNTGLQETTDILVLVGAYDNLYRQHTSKASGGLYEELKKSIRDVYLAILDFSYEARKYITIGGKRARLKHGLLNIAGIPNKEFQDKTIKIQDLRSKIERYSQTAFQQNTSDELSSVLQTVCDFQKQSSNDREEILRELKRLRPATHRELAEEEYGKNVERLKPWLERSAATKSRHRTEADEGTCTWIAEVSQYKQWHRGDTGGILCVTGEKNYGKTVLGAYICEKLRDEADNDSELVVRFISADEGSNDDKVRSIENTLLRIFYAEARDKAEDEDLLQQCNRLFVPPKQQKPKEAQNRSQETGKTVRARTAGSDSTLDFVTISRGILQKLRKRFVLVIDAIDELLEDDQDQLAKDLESLCAGENSMIRVLLLFCERSQVLSKLAKRVAKIKIADHNKNDINLLIQRGLDLITGISPVERTEIETAIAEKAGHQIKYVKQIARPFLRTPLFRPITEWLEKLSDNVDDTYHQHLHKLAPHYLPLLRIALRWALTARRPPRVEEIMEAYSGMYTDGNTSDEQINTEPDLTLYQEQIRNAAGPFLEIRDDGDDKVVALVDAQAVREFCRKGSEKSENTSEESLCAKCKNAVKFNERLVMSDPKEHVEMAITCVKHLNSASFQARHLSACLDEAKLRAGKKTSLSANSADDAKSKVETPLDSQNDNHTATIEKSELDNEERPGETAGNSEISLGPKEGEEQEEEEKEEGEEVKDRDEDDSVFSDEEDNDAASVASSSGSNLDQDNQNVESVANESGSYYDDLWMPGEYNRYELIAWFYHVQEAERVLSLSDKQSDPRWAELLRQMEQFFLINTVGFEAWKIKLALYSEEGWDPLFWSAKLGLLTLAELSLDKGAKITDTTPSGESVLHIACRAPKQSRLETLSFFLDRGGDPNFESEDTLPVFHEWLRENANADCVKEMIHRGASYSLITRKWKWNALHYVGLLGTHKEVLNLILEAIPDKEKIPNLNSKDIDGETPLHLLLSRQKIPMDILQAFLEHGADVNVDDDNSERPLQEAAYWGEHEAVAKIIARVKDGGDIDDKDSVHGRTALHSAALSGQKTTVELLLTNGADPNRTDGRNRTPLLLACLTERHAYNQIDSFRATAELLIEKQIGRGATFAQINAATKRGRTPLREAAARGFLRVVDTILERAGSDDKKWINYPDDRRRRTPLHSASIHGRADVIASLLRKGADAGLADGTGKTSMDLCIERWAPVGSRRYEDAIMQLIEARMNEAREKSTLLLTTAAVQGSMRVLEQLVNAGFDLSQPDANGWSLSELASLFGHEEAEIYIKHWIAEKALRPTQWTLHSKVKTTTTLKDDGICVSHQAWDRVCISSDHPVPANHPVYYYEIEILDAESGEPRDTPTDGLSYQLEVAVGFSTSSVAHQIKFPGWLPRSRARNIQTWAYHGDDGGFYASNRIKWPRSYGLKYGPGDTVGCGLDIAAKTIFFTRNGTRIDDHTFNDIRGRMFPILGLSDNMRLRTNFGTDVSRPLKWSSSPETSIPAKTNQAPLNGVEEGEKNEAS